MSQRICKIFLYIVQQTCIWFFGVLDALCGTVGAGILFSSPPMRKRAEKVLSCLSQDSVIESKCLEVVLVTFSSLRHSTQHPQL